MTMWWYGVSKPEDSEFYIQRAKEIGTTTLEFDLIEAFEHGDVGWFAANPVVVSHEWRAID